MLKRDSRDTAPIILNLGNRWEWLTSCPDSLPPWKISSTHWTVDWVGRRVGLEYFMKRKISYPYQNSNPRSRSPQPGRYTDYAIPPTTNMKQANNGYQELKTKTTSCITNIQNPRVLNKSVKNCRQYRCPRKRYNYEQTLRTPIPTRRSKITKQRPWRAY